MVEMIEEERTYGGEGRKNRSYVLTLTMYTRTITSTGLVEGMSLSILRGSGVPSSGRG